MEELDKWLLVRNLAAFLSVNDGVICRQEAMMICENTLEEQRGGHPPCTKHPRDADKQAKFFMAEPLVECILTIGSQWLNRSCVGNYITGITKGKQGVWTAEATRAVWGHR
jgi:hypothetical protein